MIESTIGEIVELQAKLYPDNDGLVSPLTGVRYTQKEFNEISDLIAKGFLAMGLKKGVILPCGPLIIRNGLLGRWRLQR